MWIPSLPPQGQNGENNNVVVAESLEKLNQEREVTYKVNSEIAGVELILCKDESIWLLSRGQAKHLAKHTQLGGYGNL